MTATTAIANTIVKYQKRHGLLLNMQNNRFEIQTRAMGCIFEEALLRGFNVERNVRAFCSNKSGHNKKMAIK